MDDCHTISLEACDHVATPALLHANILECADEAGKSHCVPLRESFVE